MGLKEACVMLLLTFFVCIFSVCDNFMGLKEACVMLLLTFFKFIFSVTLSVITLWI